MGNKVRGRQGKENLKNTKFILKIVSITIIWMLILVCWSGILAIGLTSKAEPVIVENESNGYWKDSFEDEVGIEVLENTTVYAGDVFLTSMVNGTNWTKQGLAVDIGSPGEPDDLYAFQSSVIKDKIGYYKMWYSGNDGSNARILYATSFDSVSWSKAGVIIDLGPPGSYDDFALNNPRVIKNKGGRYELWYEGNDGSNSRILYANSSDGILWNKVGIALDLGNPGQLDDERLRPSTVLKARNGSYKMWYDGYDGSNWRIFYATSPDGISWNKQGMVLQLGNPGDLDDTHIGAAIVILDTDGLYKMWYSGHDGSTGYRLFYATSLDGVTWTKHGLVLDLGAPGEYDENNVIGNCIIKDSDGINKMWYHGNLGIYSRTLYATSPASYNITGNIISEKISLPYDQNWDKLIINKTELSTSNYINISILDGETNIPISGFENLKDTNIDISSLDYISHPTIKLYAVFVGNGSATPILHYWEVTWADTIPPATPSGFKVNNPLTGYSLILSWNSNSEPDFEHYVLYYSTDNISFNLLINISGETISFIHYGLTTGCTYYYKIAASDEVPNQSPFSEIVESIPDLDYDGDGICNLDDPDDDNDGILDIDDEYPLNPLNDIESTIDYMNTTIEDIQTRVIDIQTILENLNLTELINTINYLNQTILLKIDDLAIQLAEVNDSLMDKVSETEFNILDYLADMNTSLSDIIQNLLISITQDIIEMNSSLSDELTNLLNSMTSEHDALKQWLVLVLGAIDDNLTIANDTLHSQLNLLNQSITSFYNILKDDIADVISDLQLHDQHTGQNHSDIIGILENLLEGQIEHKKIDELRTMLINFADNLSVHNQSIANDIMDVVNDIDAFEVNMDSQLHNINETLTDLTKLDNILQQLGFLDQLLDTIVEDLEDSIDDISTKDEDEERIRMIEFILIIVLIVLTINLLLTLILIKHLKYGEQKVVSKGKVEQEKVQGIPPPPPDSPLE